MFCFFGSFPKSGWKILLFVCEKRGFLLEILFALRGDAKKTFLQKSFVCRNFKLKV